MDFLRSLLISLLSSFVAITISWWLIIGLDAWKIDYSIPHFFYYILGVEDGGAHGIFMLVFYDAVFFALVVSFFYLIYFRKINSLSVLKNRKKEVMTILSLIWVGPCLSWLWLAINVFIWI